MNVLIAGASGLIGRALVPALRERGHTVRRLVRGPVDRADGISWQPSEGVLNVRSLDDVDAVVNLAGENIAAGRWTKVRRQQIETSRIRATRTLVTAMAQSPARPRVLLNASAVGLYGDRGDETLTEVSAPGAGFLATVCQAWEREAVQATDTGARVVRVRFGVVLAGEGGALARLAPAFRLGLGGRLANGRAWMPWIHLADVATLIECALTDVRYDGPINAVAPGLVRNAEFTRVLAHVLHRPAVLPVPGWVLRAAFGRMADEALLASTRAMPTKLQQLEFPFRFPLLEPALRNALQRAG